MIESRFLRGNVTLYGDEGKLQPISNVSPFQFPSLWHSNADARFLDAMLCYGEVPWAIELKVPTSSGAGEYYRHGITLVTMYKEFIRRAEMFYPWFEDKGLDAQICRAAWAFPTILQKQKKILRYHQDEARAF